MWVAILITVVASTGNNIGKTLQKSATAGLPRLTLDSVVLYRYLSSKEWILGLAADLGGGLLMIAAVARAPVGFLVCQDRAQRCTVGILGISSLVLCRCQLSSLCLVLDSFC